MVDHNERFIQTVQIDEIPWHRITTTYARATDFPKYFDVLWQMSDMKEVDKAGREIEINIEHQSTLWHVTPFAMIFLVRIFKKPWKKWRIVRLQLIWKSNYWSFLLKLQRQFAV